ncbi:MAG: secA, partial [Conexibacter sp.]|nr:secA [Conexibacter sp.]
GIHLRGFAQIDPLVAYKNEAYELFTDLMNSIWADFSRMVFHVEVEVEGTDGPALPQGGSAGPVAIQYTGGVGTQQPSALTAAAAAGTAGGAAVEYAEGEGVEDAMPVVQQRRVDEHETIGRNDPCWCGSGKKYKKCHGA